MSVSVDITISVPVVTPPARPGAPPDTPPSRTREAWFDGTLSACAVLPWDALGAGQEIKGPAFIESDQTTVVIYPGQTSTIDEIGNVRIGVG